MQRCGANLQILMNIWEKFHKPLAVYWWEQHDHYVKHQKHNISTRFDRNYGLGVIKKANGDVILERLIDLFLNGFGIDWSPVQVKIFHALVDSLLPRIYLDEWEQVKGRVLAQRKIDRMCQETLVNMARRNGKTWVVSGAAAAVLLTVPGISIAVFSVGKRQAGMFMTSTIEKIDMAFNKGTHVKRQGFNKIQQNQESLIYEHPEGGKQILGCYPGSTKVSFLFQNPLLKMEKVSKTFFIFLFVLDLSIL